MKQRVYYLLTIAVIGHGVACLSACGGAQTRSTRHLQVVIEGSSLMLVEGGATIPIDIHFNIDSDVLEDRSFAVLDAVAEFVESNDSIQIIEVQGHADERGSAAHNDELSTRRAEVVVDYLTTAGVHRRRLRPRGFGSTRPVTSGDDESAWSRNRRVEFMIANN